MDIMQVLARSQVICCRIVWERDKGECLQGQLAKCEFGTAHNSGICVQEEKCCTGGFWVFLNHCQQKDVLHMEKEGC